MVLRVVLVELKPEFATDAKLRQVAKKAMQVLPHAARVMDVKVHLASDRRTREAWHICILVRFASMQDPEVYRVDPIHRSFADNYLKPMQTRIHVYHFEDYEPLVPLPQT